MQRDDVDAELSGLAFDFFYWFSRFEFALKANGYLKSHTAGENAEPGWKEFVDKCHSSYSLSVEAGRLLAAHPGRQIVLVNDTLDWRPVGLDDCKSELEKVVRLVKAVRNNLFHGGKHEVAGWDDKKRTRELLLLSKAVLDQLAALAGIEADYTRHY